MSNPFSLAGKSILITGASSGIGRQCAISCSQHGANLLLLGRRQEALQQTIVSCHASSKLLSVAADITDHTALAAAIKTGVGQLGKLDGIIHCAGISTTLPLRMIKPDKLQQYLAVNVVGAIELTRLACKTSHFNAEGGSIIFLSSVMGQVGQKGKAIYSMTKGALDAGTRSLALELAKKKIRVNSIAPGVVETPMSKQAVYSQNEAARQAILEMHPLGLGQAEDVANAAIFLLSEASRWITGTTLTIDGGYTAH